MVKVSVIIPIYGVEKYIEKCARSVFEQTYPNLEIIFVDDCSPDNSIPILKHVLEGYPQMKDKTQILSYSENRGLAGARKFGLEAATGDYLLQIDSDDYIAHNMIEEMVIKAVEDQADIVICDFNMIRNEKESHLYVNPSLDPIECMKQVLTGEVHGSVANKLIRRNLYVSNGIAPIQGLNMMEDLSVMYRLLYFAKKIAYISKAFYNYQIRGGSVSSGTFTERKQENAFTLIALMSDFCEAQKIKRQDLLDAFIFFKASIQAYVLLYGRLSYSIRCPIRFFIRHPTLPIYCKMIGVLYCFNFKIAIKIIRSCANVVIKCIY